MASVHLALVKAEYSYTPQTEDELELEEDALYYLLEDDDTESVPFHTYAQTCCSRTPFKLTIIHL